MLGKDNYENIRFTNNYPFNVTTSGVSKTYPSHWHYYAELVIVLEDILEYRLNEVDYKLYKNDLLLVHPGELHALNYNQVDLSSYIIIQFDASYILSLPDIKKHQYWIKHFHYLPYQENPSLSDYIIELAFDMNHLFSSDIPFKDAMFCSKLLELFAHIGEYVISDTYILRAINNNTISTNNQLTKSIHQTELTQKMIDVCSYLSQNCNHDITLQNAADYVGFSKCHFSRLFSEFTGTSFVEFITKERLQKAVELLLDDTLTITDVAMMSGFSSISTFNRCFLKYRNDTPTNVKKKYTHMKSEE